jgi:DNA-binding transcriptional regulator LsrR (DeoR family)
MDETAQSPFAGPGEMVTAALVARRYYLANHSHAQIAQALGMSGCEVVRLLELARASGMVRITIVEAESLEL